jgi:predicted secreted hydrolase
VKWHISVPSRKLEADCAAALADQELAPPDDSEPAYWEGAVSYSGAAPGVGYLEMTGYAQPVRR